MLDMTPELFDIAEDIGDDGLEDWVSEILKNGGCKNIQIIEKADIQAARRVSGRFGSFPVFSGLFLSFLVFSGRFWSSPVVLGRFRSF